MPSHLLPTPEFHRSSHILPLRRFNTKPATSPAPFTQPNRPTRKTLFLNLPQEIRLMIFSYVLTSSSGHISFLHTHCYANVAPRYRIAGPDCYISLSFLRTCRVFYEEARDILWKCNTLEIEGLTVSEEVQTKDVLAMKGVSERLTDQVRRVRIGIDFMGGVMGPNWIHTLRGLGRWPQLEKVTLEVREIPRGRKSNALGMYGLSEMLNVRNRGKRRGQAELWQMYLAALRAGASRYLPKVERVITMTITAGSPLDRTLGIPKDDIPRTFGHPSSVLQDISEAFEAKLWTDGILSYENGNEIENVFIDCSDKEGNLTTYFRPHHLLWFCGVWFSDRTGRQWAEMVNFIENQASLDVSSRDFNAIQNVLGERIQEIRHWLCCKPRKSFQ